MSISDTPLAMVSLTASLLRSAVWRDTVGSTAVAIDTPNNPIGRYINRNAYCSHETAPVSVPVASSVLTNTLTCVAARPTVPGPINVSMRRSPGSCQSISKRYRNPSLCSVGHCSASCATPPSSVPIAIATIGSRPNAGMNGTSTNAQMIVRTLNVAGDSAGMK